jgi:transcriptional regulator with XRE-family HTH domain
MSSSLGRRFGGHIRGLRSDRKLTQEALAELSELSVDAIRRIERGAFSPSLETLSKLSGGLQVSLGTLFQDLDQERVSPVAHICDYLASRSRNEIALVWRVLRALFDDR